MTRTLAAVVAVLALAVPATASAGGFATVGLAPPPESVGPGDTWNAELTLLQHGRTPLTDLQPAPVVQIERPGGGGDVRTFMAKPTGEPGVYRARVVFPAAGRWAVAVDAFGMTHAFAPVSLDGRATSAGGPGILAALAAGLAAGLAAALLTMALQRWRPPRAVSAAR